jgi:hypothetical protein
MHDAVTRGAGVRRAGRCRIAGGVCAAALAAALAGCGGSSALDNPGDVQNPATSGGEKLSFVYYQKCINPIFLAQLRVNQNGVISTNTCASAGCHDTVSGTGGAFRVIGAAAAVDLASPANTPAAVRNTDMYKNFYSSQGSAIIGAPQQSRLLLKPLVATVLHGGGLIFENDQDPNAQRIRYWISRPMPRGQDEFSSAANTMFTPPDPNVGTCNTQ